MALTKLTDDLNVVSTLDNEPNDIGGLTAEQLKAKFDEGGNTIKTYINDSLTAELEADAAAATLGALDKDGAASTVQGELDKVSNLGGVTASPAEINVLDGITASTTELNIMDGVTAAASELNVLDGITASTAELNIMRGVTATAQDINGAVADKHSHANKSALDTLPSGGVVTALGGDNTTVPTSRAVSDALGASGNLPAGGTTGQSLVKASGTNYDTEWKSLAKADITDFPLSMNPTAHKTSHSVGGADALIDADIAISPDVATALGLTGNPQVEDALLTINALANSKAKIATGSYTGTGTFGANNPNTLIFDFEPKIIFVQQVAPNGVGSLNSAKRSFMAVNGVSGEQYSGAGNAQGVMLSWSSNTVTWYNPSGGASYQLNDSEKSYAYVAIG